MVGRLQALEPRRAGEGEIELVVVHHVEHQHVVPALPQQLQPAHQPGPIGQQIGNQDHHAAAGKAFRHLAKNREQVGLVAAAR